MTTYECFECGKDVGEEFLRKKIRCPYCSSKIVFKPRTKVTKVESI